VSSKGRKKASKAHDKYPTPNKLVRAGFDKLIEIYPHAAQARSFLEPGANAGAFCKYAEMYCALDDKPVGVELFPVRERHPYKMIKADYRTWNTKRTFDFIATNPPFTWFTEFILQSRDQLTARGMMMYLMRIGALGSKKRRPFWKKVNLCDVIMIRPRPSFQVDNQTDSSEYAFFILDGRREECSEDVKLHWLDWEGDSSEDTLY
jgi:hypothetical protein